MLSGIRSVAMPLALAVTLLMAGPARAGDGDPVAPEQVAARKAKRTKYLKVRKFKPKHRKTFVDPTTELIVKFKRPIDSDSVTQETVRVATTRGFVVDWNHRLEKNGKQLIITPAQVLDSGTDYLFEVRPGIMSTDEKPRTLKKTKRVQFFTNPDSRPFVYLRQDQFKLLSTRLSTGRAFHSAADMHNGDVLISGGQTFFDPVSGNAQLTDTCDVFDPVAVRFQALNSTLSSPRAFHPSAAVPGGAIVCGGWDGNDATDVTDIFSITTVRIQPGPRMKEQRDFHAAIGLEDGRVLVTGGLSYSPSGAIFSETAEIYDPQTGEFRYANGNPVRRRGGHLLSLLPDGRILVSGGEPPGTGAGTVEYFDPVTETFRLGNVSSGSGRQNHAVTPLGDAGVVLLCDGGSALFEYYDTKTEQFSFAGYASVVERSHSTANRLPNGQVVVVGGLDSTASNDTLALRSMDLFVPGLGDFGRVVRLNTQMAIPRAGHTSHSLPDGSVVFAGGVGTETNDSLSSVEQLTVDSE